MKIPKVAIITRTKNRAILLKRAIKSVAAQSFGDYIHVIVNDGGATDEVEKTVDASNVNSSRIRIIHNRNSVGMEAASNLGIESSDSMYVVIHDDDDSWQPNFLEETVSFLDSRSDVQGVTTPCLKVVEKICNATVEYLHASPYGGKGPEVSLMDMERENQFPPITFLYRRKVYEAIGMYNPTLPTLGDWDFNLRFLERFRIARIESTTAFYHCRPAGMSSLGNSIYSSADLHQKKRQTVLELLKARRPAWNPEQTPSAGIVVKLKRWLLEKDFIAKIYFKRYSNALRYIESIT